MDTNGKAGVLTDRFKVNNGMTLFFDETGRQLSREIRIMYRARGLGSAMGDGLERASLLGLITRTKRQA